MAGRGSDGVLAEPGVTGYLSRVAPGSTLEPAVATTVAYRVGDQFVDRRDEVESRVTGQPGRGQAGGQRVTQGCHGSRGERLPQQQPDRSRARHLVRVNWRRHTAIAVMLCRWCRAG